MTNIIPLPLKYPVRVETAHPAIERLDGIREALSSLSAIHLRTPADVSRALTVLDLANRCIRVVLDDFRDTPATLQLIEQSKSLTTNIQATRERIATLQMRIA